MLLQNSGADRVARMKFYFVIARSQRVRPEVAGPMTGSATKQSRALWLKRLDCFASLAMTKARHTLPWRAPRRVLQGEAPG